MRQIIEMAPPHASRNTRRNRMTSTTNICNARCTVPCCSLQVTIAGKRSSSRRLLWSEAGWTAHGFGAPCEEQAAASDDTGDVGGVFVACAYNSAVHSRDLSAKSAVVWLSTLPVYVCSTTAALFCIFTEVCGVLMAFLKNFVKAKVT